MDMEQPQYQQLIFKPTNPQSESIMREYNRLERKIISVTQKKREFKNFDKSKSNQSIMDKNLTQKKGLKKIKKGNQSGKQHKIERKKITKIQLRNDFDLEKYQELKRVQASQKKLVVSNHSLLFRNNLYNKDDFLTMSNLIKTQFKTLEGFKHYFGANLSDPDENCMELRRRAKNFLTSSAYIQQILSNNGYSYISKQKMLKCLNKLEIAALQPQTLFS